MEAFGKLLEGVASVLWPALIGLLLFYLRDHVRYAVSEVIARIRTARKLRLGLFEFENIETVAVSGQPVQEREVGRTKIKTDTSKQQEIIRVQELNQYAFLVHEALPLDKVKAHYDVILFIVGHFNELEHVTSVDYYLGEGWGNAVFTSRDRARNFAIKVQAVGSFLAMARLHFYDGSEVTQSRFIDLNPLY